MKIHLTLVSILSMGLAIGQQNMNETPKAKKIEKKHTTHGDTRIDNYFWMRLSDEKRKQKLPMDRHRTYSII